jgi:hydroxymethylbilane synthase
LTKNDLSLGGFRIMKVLRIGTRGSLLALAQTRWVRSRIEARYPGVKVESIVIKTAGDQFLTGAVSALGGKGVFVKEIEEALLAKEIDLSVHSMKDLPTEVTPGLTVAAIPEREDSRDVLVSRDSVPLQALQSGAKIGTASLRRRAQVLHYRADLEVVGIRGNIDTRLAKLDRGEVDGLVLAAAGLKRIQKEGRVTEYLAEEVCLSAVAQGALALETRASDPVVEMLGFLHDCAAGAEVTAERAFLQRLGGGCHLPVAARAHCAGPELRLRGIVADVKGIRLFRGELAAPVHDAAVLGTCLAERLLQDGAAEVLEAQPKA